MEERKKYILWGSPFVVLAIISIWYIGTFPSCKWAEIDSQESGSESSWFFHDLDNNGSVEKILLSNASFSQGEPSIYIFTMDDRFLDLWTLEDKLVLGNSLLVEDFNEDGKREFYCFTSSNDSLFMYAMDPQYGERFFIKEQYFLNKNKMGLSNHLSMQTIGVFDITNDGFKDLLFLLVDKELQKSWVVQYDYINSHFSFSAPVSGIICQAHRAAPGSDVCFYLSIINNNAQTLTPIKGIGENLKLVSLQQLKIPVSDSWSFNNPDAFGTIDVVQYAQQDSFALYRSESGIFELLSSYKGKVKASFMVQSILYLFTNEHALAIDMKNNETVYKTKVSNPSEVSLVYRQESPGFLVQRNNRFCLLADDLSLLLCEHVPDGPIKQFAVVRNGTGNETLALQTQTHLRHMRLNTVPWVKYKGYLGVAIALALLFVTLFIRFLWLLISQNRKLKISLGKEFPNLLRAREQYKLVKRMPLSSFIGEQLPEKSANTGDVYVAPFLSYLNEFVERVKKGSYDITFQKYPQNNWLDVDDTKGRVVIEALQVAADTIKQVVKTGRVNLQLLRDEDDIQVYVDFVPEQYHNPELIEVLKRSLTKRLKTFCDNLVVDISMENNLIIGASFSILKEVPEEVEAQSKLKVLLAEDHDVTLYGLMSLFKTNDDMEVVGTAKDGYEVLSKIKDTAPDVVVTDISMPEMDGIELTARLKKEFPQIQVVVFTMYMENWFVERLLKNGVKAMVSKSSSIYELVHAIRASVSNSSYFCPRFREKFGLEIELTDEGIRQITRQLSITEFQVLFLLKNGKSKVFVSRELGLKMQTLDTLLANLMLKLNAADVNELQRIALHLDICVPENLN